MEFTPTGFIGLLDAKEEIWELHYPGELNELIPLSDRQAVKEMNLRVNAHRKEAEKMLADALVSNRLVGEFEYPQGSANYRCVPKWYWLNKRLTTITMGSGRMELREQIIKGWADFHLAPCFIRKSAFEAWLGITGRGRKTESKSDRGKILDEFESLCNAGNISFKHGGQAKVVAELALQFPNYKPDTIRKIIQPPYNERKNKEEPCLSKAD